MTEVLDFNSKQKLSNKEIDIIENNNLKTLKLIREFINYTITRDSNTSTPVVSSLTILIRSNGQSEYHINWGDVTNEAQMIGTIELIKNNILSTTKSNFYSDSFDSYLKKNEDENKE